MSDQPQTTPPLTRRHIVALQLLARGGARYGTMHEQMHGKLVGQWTWRPTDAGRVVIAERGIQARG